MIGCWSVQGLLNIGELDPRVRYVKTLSVDSSTTYQIIHGALTIIYSFNVRVVMLKYREIVLATKTEGEDIFSSCICIVQCGNIC